MQIVLHLATTPIGTFHGTARRSTDDHAIDFHGVLELVAVLDRLLAETGTSDDDSLDA